MRRRSGRGGPDGVTEFDVGAGAVTAVVVADVAVGRGGSLDARLKVDGGRADERRSNARANAMARYKSAGASNSTSVRSGCGRPLVKS